MVVKNKIKIAYIDTKLMFVKHIEAIVASVQASLGFIKRLLKNLQLNRPKYYILHWSDRN